MKKKFLFVLLFTFVIFFLGAEEKITGDISENLIQYLFQAALADGDFSVYENQRAKAFRSASAEDSEKRFAD